MEQMLDFDLIPGRKYPIKVTMPDGTVIRGKAICVEHRIFCGAMNFAPGIDYLEIEDLSHVDEIENVLDHESSEDMIMFAINDGSRRASGWDSGFRFELSNFYCQPTFVEQDLIH